jgi:hypothetical protein
MTRTFGLVCCAPAGSTVNVTAAAASQAHIETNPVFILSPFLLQENLPRGSTASTNPDVSSG